MKWVIVGASSGIGKELYELLKSKKEEVIGIYHNTSFEGGIKCDITSEEEVKNIFSSIKDIDAVVNCATIYLDNDIYEKSAEEFKKVIDVNLLGTFLVNKYASLNMEKGVIINFSSTDGIDTFNTYSMDYCAAKAGVINLTKNMALRLPNIKFLCIAPAWVDTPSVKEMDPKFLKEQMELHNQKELLKKENVAQKVIDIVNSNLPSGSIVRMDENE